MKDVAARWLLSAAFDCRAGFARVTSGDACKRGLGPVLLTAGGSPAGALALPAHASA